MKSPHKPRRSTWWIWILVSCVGFAVGRLTPRQGPSLPPSPTAAEGRQIQASREPDGTGRAHDKVEMVPISQTDRAADDVGSAANPASMLERQATELLAHFRRYPDQLSRSDLLQVACALGRHREVAALILEHQNERASRYLAAIWYRDSPRSFDASCFGDGACGAAATIGVASILSKNDPATALRLLEENSPRISPPQEDLYLEVFTHGTLRPIEGETARWLLAQDPNEAKWTTCFRVLLREIAGSGSDEIVFFLQKVQNPESLEQMALGAVGGAMRAENFDAAERYAAFLPPDRREIVRQGITAKRQGTTFNSPE